MRVRELMQDDVISVNQDTRINDAVVTLTDARISALPVLDGGGRMVYADVRGTLDPILADTHDRWMAEADKIIGAVTEPDAIFMQRWAAVRYVWDELPVQLQTQQELLKELHPFPPRSGSDSRCSSIVCITYTGTSTAWPAGQALPGS